MKNKQLIILLAEASYIIRSGLRQILEDFRTDAFITETEKFDDLQQALSKHNPDMVIINVKLLNDPHEDFRNIFTLNTQAKFIALVGTKRKNEHFAHFDNKICIDDDKVTITKVLAEIERSMPDFTDENETSELSERERDVVKEVALGKTNKEIADTLNISTHTVITHRKNITKKLGIKTVSGITVYAIINNIISINDAV